MSLPRLFLLPTAVVALAYGGPSPDPLEEGKSLLKAGEYARAEDVLTGELDRAREGGERSREALCLKFLGNVRFRSGDPEGALSLYRKAAEIFQSLDEEGERANVLNNQSLVRQKGGELERALELQKECLAIYTKLADRQGLAASHTNLAVILRRLGDRKGEEGMYKSALAHLGEAEALSGGEGKAEREVLANVLLNRGNLLFSAGRIEEAVPAYEKAAGIFRELHFPLGEAEALANLGVALREEGRLKEALSAVSRSIDIIERLRGRLRSEKVKIAFLEDKVFLYEVAIDILFRMGRVEEAFLFSERSRSRAFLDLLGSRSLGGGKERSSELQELVEKEGRLLRELDRLSGDVDGPEYAAALKTYEGLLDGIAALDPEYAFLRSVRPSSAGEIRGLLGPDDTLVEYFLGREGGYVFVLRKDLLTGRRLAVSPEEVEKILAAVRQEVATPSWYARRRGSSWQDALHGAYGALLAPVAEGVRGARRLIVVPHGPLHHLPFAALVVSRDEKFKEGKETPRPRFLVEEHALVLLPSASVLPFARKKNPGGVSNALVMADAVYPAGWPPLPETAAEAKAVRRAVKDCELHVRKEATETRLKEDGERFGLLHLATHGELRETDPLSSRLLLTPDGKNDGSLTVPEVFGMSLNAYLVALSACETALAAARDSGGRSLSKGDDLVGLSRAFLYAGTPSLVSTLWKVSDVASNRLVTGFYRNLKKRDKAEALRRAQTDLMKRKYGGEPLHHPNLWAGYVLIGDWK